MYAPKMPDKEQDAEENENESKNKNMFNSKCTFRFVG